MATTFTMALVAVCVTVVVYFFLYFRSPEEVREIFLINYWWGKTTWYKSQRFFVEVRTLGSCLWASQGGYRITPVVTDPLELQYHLKNIGAVYKIEGEEVLHMAGAGQKTALVEVYTILYFKHGGKYAYVVRRFWQPANGYNGYCCTLCGSTETENVNSCACANCHAC